MLGLFVCDDLAADAAVSATPLGRVIAARACAPAGLFTLVFYGLRDGHIRCLHPP